LGELALLEIENGFVGGEYLGEEAGLGPGKETLIGSFVAAIEETVIEFVMAMQVTEYRNPLRRITR
jgi:hypothetical protein